MLCVLQEFPPSPAELQAAADGLTNDPAHLHSLSTDLGTVALGQGTHLSTIQHAFGLSEGSSAKGAHSF